MNDSNIFTELLQRQYRSISWLKHPLRKWRMRRIINVAKRLIASGAVRVLVVNSLNDLRQLAPATTPLKKEDLN